MSQAQDQWIAVDQFIAKQFLPHDPALEQTLADSHAAGLPEISVTPCQGKFLGLFAKAMGAKKILEIGTLGGYSTIWLARALPANGRLVTLELDPQHAAIAQANFAAAGLADRIDLRIGPAADTLRRLASEGCQPFDFTFIDADKASTADYLRAVLPLSRPGSVIVIDNVVRAGKVVDAASEDPDIQGVRRCLELLQAEPRITATAIQTVGSKGYDGLIIAMIAG
jgi:predicted O-methyltransferase YrrM